MDKKLKLLPDILIKDLKILFVGYNPGMVSAKTGHHYAGKSNRFWKLLHQSDMTPTLFSPQEDRNLLSLGYGSTNIVDRPTTSSAEITNAEFKEGARSLYALIQHYSPRIVCYVGIGVYKAFASAILNVPISRMKITTGIQSENIIHGITDFVCSNPSGLNTIPIEDQLSCFKELKRLSEVHSRTK
ncbi:MAG: mismatch-specific DNA-glycosylase [Clostridia bacterium]|nr:mismatch-specific DNA-glycosylase [Clostridia bacterium]